MHRQTFAVLVLCGVLGFVAGAGPPDWFGSVLVNPPSEREYGTGPLSGSGVELQLVYIGSSSCRPSNVEDLPEIFQELKLRVAAKAAANGYGFAAAGIARDQSVRAGLSHLNKFGPFDEVFAGRGWLNSGVRKYIYQQHPGIAATPQVLVVERVITRDSLVTAVADLRVLARKVGYSEIKRWRNRGAPVAFFADQSGE